MLCQFIMYSRVNQPCIHIYPLFLGFPSHLDRHGALSRVLCAIQLIFINYLFYRYQCVYNNLPIHPTPRFPPWYPSSCSLYLCLQSCFANKFFYTIFLPGEGNGNPLQCSCLENPMDRGAWWAISPWGRKELDMTDRLTYIPFSQIPQVNIHVSI